MHSRALEDERHEIEGRNALFAASLFQTFCGGRALLLGHRPGALGLGERHRLATDLKDDVVVVFKDDLRIVGVLLGLAAPNVYVAGERRALAGVQGEEGVGDAAAQDIFLFDGRQFDRIT